MNNLLPRYIWLFLIWFTATIKSESFNNRSSTSPYIRGCYYTVWSQYRRGKEYTPESYEVGLCNYIFYAFVLINPDYTLKKKEWNDEENYKQINNYKLIQEDLKTLLSFAGGQFSQEQKSLIKSMVSTRENRKKFVNSALDFVKEYKFDGLDMDWEFPEADDKQNFAQLIKELTEKFHASGLLVTAAVANWPDAIDAGYDVPSLANSLDFVNVMTYDLHGPEWQNVTGFNSPLYDRNGDRISMKSVIDYWASKGMPKSKIVVGFATYGHSWTLSSPSENGVGARGTTGAPGSFTKSAGVLAYYEVADMLNSGGVRNFDEIQKVPYAVKDNQWVGYDDVESFKFKLDWLKNEHFGGAFIWALDMDDFTGSSSDGQKYPLMKTINQALTTRTARDLTRPKTNQPQTVKLVTVSPRKFVCTHAGIFANPFSCSSFYNCDASKVAHLMHCPSGLRFNKNIKTCDWPANAQCDQM